MKFIKKSFFEFLNRYETTPLVNKVYCDYLYTMNVEVDESGLNSIVTITFYDVDSNLAVVMIYDNAYEGVNSVLQCQIYTNKGLKTIQTSGIFTLDASRNQIITMAKIVAFETIQQIILTWDNSNYPNNTLKGIQILFLNEKDIE